MRLNHIVAALAVVACLAFAASAFATGPLGACCDGSGLSCKQTTAAPCDKGDTYLGVGSDCGGCFTSGGGACCGGDLDPGTCFVTVDANACTALVAGIYKGDGTRCIGVAKGDDLCPPDAPAVSEWGIASLGLLLLAGLTIKFRGALPKRA